MIEQILFQWIDWANFDGKYLI